MTAKVRSLLEEVLALAEKDRAFMAQKLLDSISPDCPDVDEDEFLAELERRADEARRDPSKLIPWEVVEKSMQKEIKKVRAKKKRRTEIKKGVGSHSSGRRLFSGRRAEMLNYTILGERG